MQNYRDSKESACNARDGGSLPGLGRFPGEENGNQLQYSRLENSRLQSTGWQATNTLTQRDRKKDQWLPGFSRKKGMNRQSTENFQDSETILYDTTVVDTCQNL